MEATDLEARRQDVKHEEPNMLTREQAVELFARLDDAGLKVALTRHTPGSFDSDQERHVVTVTTDSIGSVDHLRLIADKADSYGVPTSGQYGNLRLG